MRVYVYYYNNFSLLVILLILVMIEAVNVSQTDTVKAESESSASAVGEKTQAQPPAPRPPAPVPAKKPAIAVELPLALKAWLADDSDLVLRERHIVKLPARVTVTDILAQYVAAHPEELPPNAPPDAVKYHSCILFHQITLLHFFGFNYFTFGLGSAPTQ